MSKGSGSTWCGSKHQLLHKRPNHASSRLWLWAYSVCWSRPCGEPRVSCFAWEAEVEAPPSSRSSAFFITCLSRAGILGVITARCLHGPSLTLISAEEGNLFFVCMCMLPCALCAFVGLCICPYVKRELQSNVLGLLVAYIRSRVWRVVCSIF